MAVESIGATVYSLIACDTYRALVLADTPVAYYRHEIGAIGTDSSGNNNDATTTTAINNAISAFTDCTGNAGDYNGSTSKQLVPNSATIQNLGYVSNLSGKQFTIEFLINIASAPGANQVIISKDYQWEGSGSNGNGGWEVIVQTDLKLKFQAPTTGVTTLNVVSSTALSTNTWHHVAIVGQGGTVSRDCAFYIDGVLEEHNSGMTEPGIGASGLFVDTANDLRLGCGTDDPTGALNRFFDGYLDEVALYSYKLSSGRIWEHARALNITLATYPTAVLAASPVAYYRMEGDSTNLIAGDDWTSNANDASTFSGTLASAAGTIGDAVDFTAGPYFLVTNDVTTNQNLALGSNIFSVEAIVHADSLATARCIAAKGASQSTKGWCVILNTTGLVDVQTNYDTTRGIFRSPAGSIVTGTTYHIVAVMQGNSTNTTGVRKIYINNVAQTITHISNPAGSQASDSTHPLAIGTRRAAGDAAYEIFMDGRMDEVAIYNRELTSSEVAAHFALTGL